MLARSNPLVPRDPDGILRVILIGRVSMADIEGMEASIEAAKRYLAQIYDGPVHIAPLGEQNCGMLRERKMMRSEVLSIPRANSTPCARAIDASCRALAWVPECVVNRQDAVVFPDFEQRLKCAAIGSSKRTEVLHLN